MQHRATVALALLISAVLLALLVGSTGQLRAQGASPPSFDVASIKPNRSGTGMEFYDEPPGGRFVALNVSPLWLIRHAYHLRDDEVANAPRWIDEEHFDINARSADPNPTAGQMSLMVRALLANRFNLQSHPETRDVAVYTLSLTRRNGRLGDHLRPSVAGCRGQTPSPSAAPPPRPAGTVPCGMRGGANGTFTAVGITIDQLIETLVYNVNRTIIDRTGLTGLFDLELLWTPDRPARNVADAAPPTPTVTDRPSLFTALQEQLGLKLEPGRAPGTILVIDRIERPSEN